MKKIISVLLITMSLVCFCSCGNNTSDDNFPTDITNSDIAIAVVDYLSNLPNGSKTSISKSISAIYGKDFASNKEDLDLSYIYTTVLELAEEHGIVLESPYPDGTLTGLPYNTFFIVRKK